MKTKSVISFLNVICYIIFIGLCIQTGTLVFNLIFEHFKPELYAKLYLQLGLKETYDSNIYVYNTLMISAILISGLKAFLFYTVILLIKKLNIDQPFSENVQKLISKISIQILVIGILGILAHALTESFIAKGFSIGIIEKYWSDGESFLLFAAVAFVIAHIFKKGIEIQQENDLTV